MSDVVNCNISRTMPSSVSVSKGSVSICVGNTYKLKAEITPLKATQSVNWSSSNTSVATVDANGTVTAKKAGTVTITAKSSLDSSKKASCTVIVKDETFDIITSLTRDEYYYLVYPSGILPYMFIDGKLVCNMPLSPRISTLSWEQKLLSIPISRKYYKKTPNSETLNALKDDLNSKLGNIFTYNDAYNIYAEYGMAVSTHSLGDQPAHLYTPEAVQKCCSDYMANLNILTTYVTFKLAASLNPFDSNGNIKFKPDKYTKYYDSNGNPIWPGTNGDSNIDGFMNGICEPITFQIGDTFDRYGGRNGKFAAPVGTPLSARSLPPGSNLKAYEKYIVNKPFNANTGITAPWFNQPGGGIQYKLPMSINELIDKGYISVTK